MQVTFTVALWMFLNHSVYKNVWGFEYCDRITFNFMTISKSKRIGKKYESSTRQSYSNVRLVFFSNYNTLKSYPSKEVYLYYAQAFRVSYSGTTWNNDQWSVDEGVF